MATAGQNPARITLLLVDDQPFVGAAVGQLIATEGDMELHCCHQASAAVAAAIQLRPTLILQDLVMPDGDGLTLVGQFRANHATAHTPVVVLSGDDAPDTRERSLAAGACDYLVKLPSKDVLLACIRRHATGVGATNASASPLTPSATARDEDQTLDLSVLESFRQADPTGSPQMTATLVSQFLAETTARVGALRDAVRRRDAAAVQSTAHALKGSALIMGATRLGTLCGRLEEAARGPGADSVQPSAAMAVAAEFMRLRVAFTEALERMSREYADRAAGHTKRETVET